MTRHMPPVPPANRSNEGSGGGPKIDQDTAAHHPREDTAEQGETANVKQNTTDKGALAGRRAT